MQVYIHANSFVLEILLFVSRYLTAQENLQRYTRGDENYILFQL